MAICPSHPDKNPSLSIKEGDERILLYCHGSCSQDEILEGMGLTWRDIVYNAVNYSDPEAVYTYENENGETLFEVLRFPGKKIRQRHTDPETGEEVWSLDDVRRVLY